MKALGLIAALVWTVFSSMGQELPFTWRYTLLEGSYVVDECPICGRPTIYEPIRGQFTLEANSTTNELVITNILFTNINYTITGGGTLRFENDRQFALLQLQILRDGNVENLSFTNEVTDVDRRRPMIHFTVREETSSLVRVYGVAVAAAPLHDLWFSTTSQFTSTNRPAESNIITSAEILSMTGRTVKKPAELSRLLALEDPFADLATDALDIGMEGEVFFSLGQPLASATLGEIGEGDLVTDRGRVVLHNQQLLALLEPEPADVDAGLDAVQHIVGDEYYFSIRTNLLSAKIGAQIFRGDILSSQGTIVRTLQQLISALNPLDVEVDAGLDAFYLWPHGEIWFSTETGFDTQLGPVSPGDILSDRGYVVFRNLNLLQPFAPLEDASNFGLDALYVVTDLDVRGSSPRFTAILREAELIRLEWEGTGRVFQVESAGSVDGPYLPVSPLLAGKFWVDQRQAGAAFYRVRQW